MYFLIRGMTSGMSSYMQQRFMYFCPTFSLDDGGVIIALTSYCAAGLVDHAGVVIST